MCQRGNGLIFVVKLRQISVCAGWKEGRQHRRGLDGICEAGGDSEACSSIPAANECHSARQAVLLTSGTISAHKTAILTILICGAVHDLCASRLGLPAEDLS